MSSGLEPFGVEETTALSADQRPAQSSSCSTTTATLTEDLLRKGFSTKRIEKETETRTQEERADDEVYAPQEEWAEDEEHAPRERKAETSQKNRRTRSRRCRDSQHPRQRIEDDYQRQEEARDGPIRSSG